MNQKDMVNMCSSYGYDFCILTIYRYGKKEGFLKKIKETGRERYEVDEKKFIAWLERGRIDKSFVALKDAAKENNTSYSELLYLLKKNNCEISKLGIKQNGLLYAKRTDIKRIINQYHKRSEKEM